MNFLLLILKNLLRKQLRTVITSPAVKFLVLAVTMIWIPADFLPHTSRQLPRCGHREFRRVEPDCASLSDGPPAAMQP